MLNFTLFLATRAASAMGQFGGLAIFTYQKTRFFKRMMRPTSADFAVGMMFYWYATHRSILLGQPKKVKLRTLAGLH